MKKHEHGSVLVLALLVTMLILGIGLTVMWVATTGTKVSSNLTRRQEALYSAETCLARTQKIFVDNLTSWQTLLNGNTAETIPNDPTGKGNIILDPAAANVPLVNIPVFQNSSIGSDGGIQSLNRVTYTAYARNDSSEWAFCDGVPDGETLDCLGDGNNKDDEWRNLQDRDDRIIIRCEGRGQDGLSLVALEIIFQKPQAAAAGTPPYGGLGGNAAGANSQRGAKITAQ